MQLEILIVVLHAEELVQLGITDGITGETSVFVIFLECNHQIPNERSLWIMIFFFFVIYHYCFVWYHIRFLSSHCMKDYLLTCFFMECTESRGGVATLGNLDGWCLFNASNAVPRKQSRSWSYTDWISRSPRGWLSLEFYVPLVLNTLEIENCFLLSRM